MDDQPIDAVVALVANGFVTSYVMLVNCLKNIGILDDGRLEKAMRSTIDHPGAESDRLDYQVLKVILAQLEGKPPPALRVILGGLSE